MPTHACSYFGPGEVRAANSGGVLSSDKRLVVLLSLNHRGNTLTCTACMRQARISRRTGPFGLHDRFHEKANTHMLLRCPDDVCTANKSAAFYISLNTPQVLYRQTLRKDVRTYLLAYWPVWGPR